MRKSATPSEAEIIARASRAFEAEDSRVIVGIGDDAAILRASTAPGREQVGRGGQLVVTTDVLIEGTHFDLRLIGLADLGYKALMVNLSDVAAMGGRPNFAFATLGLPRAASLSDIDALLAGVREAAAAGGTRLAGGDTTRAPQWLLGFSVIGELAGAPLRRSGARPGDVIWHSGSLGLSQTGFHLLWAAAETDQCPAAIDAHRRPRARLDLGTYLQSFGHATACIDLSDSLSQCLLQLADASRVGLSLDFSSYSFAPELQAFRRRLRAWHGGGPGAFRLPARWWPEKKGIRYQSLAEYLLASAEDYQLLFTAPPSATKELLAECPEPITRLGTVLASNQGRRYQDEHGQTHKLHAVGFKHL